MTRLFGDTVAVPVPSVGGVRVRIRLLVPEKATPQADGDGAPARVSVFSRPVEGPCVKVIEDVALPVKS